MISHVKGELLSRDIDRIEVLTAGGIGYEMHIPLGVFEHLPPVGETVSLHTHLAVKEDGWQLFGFSSMFERDVFRRILVAKGVGPGLALGMISTLTAPRVVRAIRQKDVGLLSTVPRIGRKKAEQVILDLADKLDELAMDSEEMSGPSRRGATHPEAQAAEDATKALETLGYSSAESDKAVRAAVESGAHGAPTADLIKRALAFASGSGRK